MKNTREMIKVMQAYDNGELCQVYTNGAWKDMNRGGVCLFDWADYDYRIKPKETPTERKVKVMQAWLDGKTIEVTSNVDPQCWNDCILEPSWDWYRYTYRIKNR